MVSEEQRTKYEEKWNRKTGLKPPCDVHVVIDAEPFSSQDHTHSTQVINEY
jgi:hypothetical protein